MTTRPEALRWTSAIRQVSAQSSAGFFARLDGTRIGSPGIFGERDPKALFKGAKPQVAHERKSVGYQASFPARHLRLPSHRRAPRPPLTVSVSATGGRGSGQTSPPRGPSNPGPSPWKFDRVASADHRSVPKELFPKLGERRAGLPRLALVHPARTAVPVCCGWRLAPRLCRLQRQAGEVGLAGMPRSSGTLGRRQHAVWVDLPLETIEHGPTGRRCPGTGVSGVGPRLVRGEPRNQGAVGRHGNEAAFPSPAVSCDATSLTKGGDSCEPASPARRPPDSSADGRAANPPVLLQFVSAHRSQQRAVRLMPRFFCALSTGGPLRSLLSTAPRRR
jgi:hypothetical protein